MANPYFEFKRFKVWHDKCAMPVGTDGVLLGAWCDVSTEGLVLDIGTGSGLIALMLAQRSAGVRIDAVDIDPASLGQAEENFAHSEFASRLSVISGDFLEFPFKRKYHLIVSNPPFFTEDTHAPDRRRGRARSEFSLPLDGMLEKCRRLLEDDGKLSLVMPHGRSAEVIGLAAMHGLYLSRRCDVQSSGRKPPFRSLLQFTTTIGTATTEQLLIHEANGDYSQQFRLLTQDFYLT